MGEDMESKQSPEGTDRQAYAWYESHANATDSGSWSQAAQEETQVQPERPAFVRQRTPHHTQPPVDDLRVDDAYSAKTSHDTGYTLSNRRPMAGSTYRRSRSSMTKVQKELRYGQYLSVPKGSHEIFGKRERIRRRQIAVAIIAVVAIVVVIAIFLSMPR